MSTCAQSLNLSVEDPAINWVSIASFMPLPGNETPNDVLLKYQDEYSAEYGKDRIEMIHPFPYVPGFLKNASPNLRRLYDLRQSSPFTVRKYPVYPCPYLGLRRFIVLNAMLSATLTISPHLNHLQYPKNNELNLIHAHNLFPDGWIALRFLKQRNIPYVITIRHHELIRSPIIRKIASPILAGAAAITVVNRAAKNWVEAMGFSAEWIPHGVDNHFFTEVINRYEGDTTVRVLCACKLIPLKNVNTLLRAFSRVKTPNVQLTIAGSGPEEANLRLMAKDLFPSGKVKFVSRIPYETMPKLMAQHDLFVMASNPEIFGRVYLEAMATGLPIIYSRNTGIDGFVQDGECGFGVSPQNEEELTLALERLISSSSLRKELGAQARKKALNYSWSAVIKRYGKLYRNVSSGK